MGTKHGMKDKKGKPKKPKKWVDQMDEDVPECRSLSIFEIEENEGHGFWGSQSKGYIKDKEEK